MREESAPADAIVSRTAARQHGVVSARQLHAAGIDKDGILRRVRAGRLHRIHRGVYAVGHARLSKGGRWTAALLACGEGAVLSHRSAADLWGLLPGPPGTVEISIRQRSGKKRRNGIRLHRASTLLPAQTTRHRGMPVTTPPRTISDLVGVVSAVDLRRAIRQADVLDLTIGREATADGTRSELEHLFLQLCRRHRLAMPEVNVRIGDLIVDFLWREPMLVVETDGYRFHRGRSAFETDRARDLELRSLGYDVIRLSYRQVANESQSIAAALRLALSAWSP